MTVIRQEMNAYLNTFVTIPTALHAPPGATLHLGLHTEDPTPDGSLGELIAGTDGYQRAPITLALSTTANSENLENSAPVIFPASTGTNADDIEYYVIYDAITAGNPLLYGKLASPVVWTDTASIAFATGMLVIEGYVEESTCTIP